MLQDRQCHQEPLELDHEAESGDMQPVHTQQALQYTAIHPDNTGQGINLESTDDCLLEVVFPLFKLQDKFP